MGASKTGDMSRQQFTRGDGEHVVAEESYRIRDDILYTRDDAFREELASRVSKDTGVPTDRLMSLGTRLTEQSNRGRAERPTLGQIFNGGYDNLINGNRQFFTDGKGGVTGRELMTSVHKEYGILSEEMKKAKPKKKEEPVDPPIQLDTTDYRKLVNSFLGGNYRGL